MSFELNHKEYGLQTEENVSKTINVHFNPSEYGILNDYSVVKEIYRVMLSPTIITLTTHKETNLVSNFKQDLSVIHDYSIGLNHGLFVHIRIGKPFVIYQTKPLCFGEFSNRC